MFKRLDMYISKTILITIAITLATLLSLSSIIKFVDQIHKVGEGSYDLLKAINFVLLTIPRDIEIFFPMAALLGALIGLGTLASNSELIVMQAAGFSKLKIGFSVLKTAIPLIIIVMTLGQWGAPQAQKFAREMRAAATSGGNLLAVKYGVWAKDNDSYIYLGQITNKKKLSVINVWTFSPTEKLKTYISADSADYISDNNWQLNNAKVTTFSENNISAKSFPHLKWVSNLTPDKMEVVTVKPEELSLTGVYSYIDYLKSSKQDASRYELAFWRKLLQPFSIAVMMLLALSFVFGPLRSVSMGTRVLCGVVGGFVFYIADQVLGPLALVYHLPVIVGAVGPSIIFLLLTIYLLNKKI